MKFIRIVSVIAIVCIAVLLQTSALAKDKPRARDLGVPFDGTPGPLNAITDVPGVTVGFSTLISGRSKLKIACKLPIDDCSDAD